MFIAEREDAAPPWYKQIVAADGMVESTRKLFALMAVISLLLAAPAILWAMPGVPGMAATAPVVLTLSASWICGYRARAIHWWMDVVDVPALTALALLSPAPVAALSVIFPALWFRGLYGTTRGSLVRCSFYCAGLYASVLLWPVVHEGDVPSLAPLIGATPTLFLTVIVARRLGSELNKRARSFRRDSVLAAAGSEMLRLREPSAIREAAWEAMGGICAETPGLRVLKTVKEVQRLTVERTAGDYIAIPSTLPSTVIAADEGPGEGTITDTAPLNALTGTPCIWTCIELPEQEEKAWLIVGAPGAIPPDALVAIHSQVNQTNLALRSSDVHRELVLQAHLDPLTSLANRTAFSEALADDATRNRATDAHILFMDLDDFKGVNDAHGHAAGDELLNQVGTRLRSLTRAGDLRARLGGDEFAVILQEPDPAVATAVAARIVEALAEPFLIGGRTAKIGASVGVTSVKPGLNAEELLRQADMAMYEAKRKGKNRVEVFSNALWEKANASLNLERDLKRAAADGQLVVYYQPILSLPKLECDAVEALVRWQHPEHGLLAPGRFIDAAESTGAIIDIGSYVLRQACTDAMRWAKMCEPPAALMHVNVSAKELDDVRYVDAVKTCLRDTGMPPTQLVLELTETTVLSSPGAIERMKVLADHGVRIAIDDFGTGYSSLAVLHSLPVNLIKLDKSFIDGALSNPVDATLLRTITRMCAELGISTVAEGVEKAEQQRFLESIGADFVQGYLYQCPIPAVELEQWFKSASPASRKKSTFELLA